VTWGVEAYWLGTSESAEGGLLPLADRTLLDNKLAKQGETVVVMAGRLSDAVLSLSMKIHTVGELSGT
jgi:hypothetical protein